MKLWIYTNYDCNLACVYCVAKSSPLAQRRAIPLSTVISLVDEAVMNGFTSIYFTGGEPMLLDDIYEMVAYSSKYLPTTILTNAMLIKGKRLERLLQQKNKNLFIQVSLDGATATDHDAYRGKGTWDATMEGIDTLLKSGFQLKISTTETPANTHRICDLIHLVESLGISKENHLIRPLAKRGFSQEGIDVGVNDVSPEITANVDGLFWHPLATDEDMLITQNLFPLSNAVEKVNELLSKMGNLEEKPLKSFT